MPDVISTNNLHVQKQSSLLKLPPELISLILIQLLHQDAQDPLAVLAGLIPFACTSQQSCRLVKKEIRISLDPLGGQEEERYRYKHEFSFIPQTFALLSSQYRHKKYEVLKGLPPQDRCVQVYQDPTSVKFFLSEPAFFTEHLPSAAHLETLMQFAEQTSWYQQDSFARVMGGQRQRQQTLDVFDRLHDLLQAYSLYLTLSQRIDPSPDHAKFGGVIYIIPLLAPNQLGFLKHFMQEIILSDYLPPQHYIEAVLFNSFENSNVDSVHNMIKNYCGFITGHGIGAVLTVCFMMGFFGYPENIIEHYGSEEDLYKEVGHIYSAYLLVNAVLKNCESSECKEALSKYITRQAQAKIDDQKPLQPQNKEQYTFTKILGNYIVPIMLASIVTGYYALHNLYDNDNSSRPSP